jgi:Holliday junction resolvase
VSVNRRAARRDKNERALIQAFAELGVTCTKLSGEGLPDLLCAYRSRWWLVEIKTARGRLEPAQVRFRDLCRAMRQPWAVVQTEDHVRSLVKAWGGLVRDSSGSAGLGLKS